MTIRELIKEFGEENSSLIEDAINWLNANETVLNLDKPICKKQFIKDLLEHRAKVKI